MRDGILTHTGRASRRRSRARSSASSTASPTSTTTSTTRSASASSAPDDLPRDEVELLGATGSRRIDTLVHDLVESSERAGDIVQSDEVGEAMLSLRSFMFERVYLGPQTRAEHERARDRATSSRADLRPPAAEPRRRAVERRSSDFLAGMTDRSRSSTRRRASRLARASRTALRRRGQGGGRHGRRRLRAHAAAARPARASPAAARSTRSGRRASRSTRTTSSSTASAAARAATSITFVREIENLDFAEAIEWLADRFGVPARVRGVVARRGGAPAARQRLHDLLEQAARFYERYLWESQGGGLARDYLAGRGLGEEICREFRLGLAPAARRSRARRSRRDSRATSCARPGSSTGAGNDYFPQRLMFPLADARGRVVGFQARKLHEDDPLRAKYVNSPEGELFHKSAILYGLHLARPAIRKQERAVVVEGNTDVIALRQAGFEPVVASMGTALTEQQLKELSRLTRRLVLCFDGDAAGEAATLRGMELAASQGFDVRVVPLPPGLDPADVADGFEAQLARAETYVGYRVRLEIERVGGSAGGVRPRARGALARGGLARAAGGAAVRRRPARPAEGDAGGTRAGRPCGGSRRARSRRGCWTRASGSSATRSRASSGTAASCACSRELGPGTSTTRCTAGSSSRSSLGRRPATRSSSRCSPSWTPGPRPRGSTRRRPSSCSCACASDGCAASSRAPTRPVCPTSSRRSRRCARRSASSSNPGASAVENEEGAATLRPRPLPIPGSSIGRASGC